MPKSDTVVIPFSSFGKTGSIEVVYKENLNAEASGFEILKNLVSDVNMCLGYPTVRASVKKYPGDGYYRYCGWIQVLMMEFYADVDSKTPDEIHYDADVLPVMKENGLPFFAYGYPAVLYDAPCNNFFFGAKLVWKAETFLISMPSYVNNNTISCLAGFRWGYIECSAEGQKHVDITPIEISDAACWEAHLGMLRREFPTWSFC
jgi:hypothetical protein